MASENNLCLALYINVQISCKRLFLSVDRQAIFKSTIRYNTYNSVLRAILRKNGARSKICGQAGSPIWLKFCMQTWLGVLITKWIFLD